MPKKRKKELQIEHNQLLSIFENINEPVYVSDPVSYEILYANGAIRVIFGEVVGQLCYRALQKEDKPCSFCTNDRIFGANEGAAYSWSFQNKTNSRWYHCVDKAIPWPDGRMVRYEMAFDITEQKKTEAEFDRFFNLSMDMLAISGFDGYAKRVNPAFSETIGFTKEEILSKPFLEFVHQDDRAATIAKLVELANGAKVSRFDQRVLCKDGSFKWVSWTNVPVVEEGLMYAVARDISELKLVEAQLKAAKENLEKQNMELRKLDKIKDGIIRDVSHELKTPVAKLSMQLEILKAALSNKGLGDDLKKPLQVMETTIKRQESTIRNILELSRLESGGRSYCRARAGLDRILSSVIDDYRQDFEAMNIAVYSNLEPLEIQSDKEMIWHVFSNLFNNAIKFMRKGPTGKIAVSLRRDGEGAVASIKDNGIGMSEEEVGKAFEPFYQASPSKEGCGVGLSICKLIIEELGGRITIESQGSGQGSTVKVHLPFAAPDF